MIVDERMSAFIDSLDKGNTPFLDEIEKYAIETQVPIIRKSMQSLLKFLLGYAKPKNILEVGTAIGFSALLMSEYAPKGCRITTIEKYEKESPLPGKISNVREKKRLSPCWKGMLQRFCRSWKAASTLFSWMPQKASTLISCRILCVYWLREDF